MQNQKPIIEQISWEAPEFEIREKNLQWYMSFAVIAIGLLAFAIFSKSIMTIITFALLIAVAYFFSTKKPAVIRCTLNNRGVSMEKILYPYKNIKSYWLVYKPPYTKILNFETTAYLNNIITLQLADQNPVVVKLFLRKYLPEDLDREESLTDVIARKAKF